MTISPVRLAPNSPTAAVSDVTLSLGGLGHHRWFGNASDSGGDATGQILNFLYSET
jgi:hypothetical protein